MDGESQQSFALLKNFLRFAVSSIASYRNILPTESFVERQFCGTRMKMIDAVDEKGGITCEKGYRLSQWIERAVFPCIQNGYIQSFVIVILYDKHVNESQNVTDNLREKMIETFRFRVDYLYDNSISSATKTRLEMNKIRNLIQSLEHYLATDLSNCDSRQQNLKISTVLEYTPTAPLDFCPDFFSKSTPLDPLDEQSRFDFHHPNNISRLPQSSLQIQDRSGNKNRNAAGDERMNEIAKSIPIRLGSYGTNHHKLSIEIQKYQPMSTSTVTNFLFKQKCKSRPEHSLSQTISPCNPKKRNRARSPPQAQPFFKNSIMPPNNDHISPSTNMSNYTKSRSPQLNAPTLSETKRALTENRFGGRRVYSPFNRRNRLSPFTPISKSRNGILSETPTLLASLSTSAWTPPPETSGHVRQPANINPEDI